MSDTQAAPLGSVVKDEPMTDRSHIDPDKHWIGESLPAASDQDTTYSGSKTSAGTSPFPARANHSHDNRAIFGTWLGPDPAQTVGPGFTYLNGFRHYLGRNLLAPSSTQVFQIPETGIYEFLINISISRNGGGYFTGDLNLYIFYFNGVSFRGIFRTSMFDIPSYYHFFAIDHAHFGDVQPNYNIQFRLDHSDSVAWTVAVQYVEITRMHAYGSA